MSVMSNHKGQASPQASAFQNLLAEQTKAITSDMPSGVTMPRAIV
jgi:hypothetical protein